MKLIAALPLAAAVAGCDLIGVNAAGRRPAPAQADQAPALLTSISLPGGGTAHVLRVPTDGIEQSTCVVAVSAAGQVAVTCTNPTVAVGDAP